MSYNMMNAVWHIKGLTGNEKILLLALADHYNEKSKLCCPGTTVLVNMTGLAPRTLDRVKIRLSDKELIQYEPSTGGNQYNNTNRYVLLFEPLKRGATPVMVTGVKRKLPPSNVNSTPVKSASTPVMVTYKQIEQINNNKESPPPLNGYGRSKSKPGRIDFKRMVEEMRRKQAAEN